MKLLRHLYCDVNVLFRLIYRRLKRVKSIYIELTIQGLHYHKVGIGEGAI